MVSSATSLAPSPATALTFPSLCGEGPYILSPEVDALVQPFID